MTEHDHAYIHVQPSTVGELTVLRAGNIVLDVEGYRARRPDGSYVQLRAREHQLLRVLMEHPGRVMSEHDLLTLAWGAGYQAGSNTLAVHIRRLRHALDPGRGRIYRNIPRAGYTFTPEGETASCRAPDGTPATHDAVRRHRDDDAAAAGSAAQRRDGKPARTPR